MSNLLLITDVARLQNVFGRLVEDETIRLRVVSSLEMGGEEIAIEKPDVVFVQTHLSGLSADIILKHLKKQLGRKRSRFVLLATPAQTNETTLKTYQGWLDSSADDDRFFADLLQLLDSLLNKLKKGEDLATPEPDSLSRETSPLAVSNAESSALLGRQPPQKEDIPTQEDDTRLQFPVVPAADEPSLEEQGITYAPRPRMTIHSEFNSSFDSAVSSTPEPESLEQAAVPPVHDWRDEEIDIIDARPTQSKKSTFLIWLVPVVIVVVVVTLLQQQKSSLTSSPSAKSAAPSEAKPAVTAPPAAPSPPVVAAVPEPAVSAAPVAVAAPAPVTAPAPTPAAVPHPAPKQERVNGSAPPKSPAPGSEAKPSPTAPPSPRLRSLPGFIPVNGLDKKYGVANPGWERYEAKSTEFKVFREAQSIRAIQVIDRSGNGVQEGHMRKILRQVTPSPVFKVESSEKKDGYEIQRGRISDTIKVVYYRDEKGGRLRAMLLTWQ